MPSIDVESGVNILGQNYTKCVRLRACGLALKLQLNDVTTQLK